MVQNDKLTHASLDSYWDAIDAAFKFNAQRRDIFVAKKVVNDAANKFFCKEDQQKQEPKEVERKSHKDPVPDFFKKHRNDRNDRFHWHCKNAREDRNNRFFLPRVGRH